MMMAASRHELSEGMNNIEEAIMVLEKVLAGDISAHDTLTEWPSVDEEANETMIGAWHEPTHHAARSWESVPGPTLIAGGRIPRIPWTKKHHRKKWLRKDCQASRVLPA
ncbi:MAG: hypothetical protein ACR2RF_20150 [Geminicoccaceae bacterium]